MTTERIEIAYVDDKIDLQLTDYLNRYVDDFNKDSNAIVLGYNEIEFKQNYTYDTLFNNQTFRHCDIAVIDSKLYENTNARGHIYTGEDLKLLVRNYSPFIDIIVITQNEISENSATIRKSHGNENPEEHYNSELKPLLDYSIKCCTEYKFKLDELKTKSTIDKAILDRISDLINHEDTYNLTVKDVDEIIKLFNEIKGE